MTRASRGLRPGLSLLALLVCACGSPESPPAQVAPLETTSTATETSEPPVRQEPAAEAPAEPPTPCNEDGDCHFDDACIPRSCVAGPVEEQVCEESAPDPGRCLCIANRCALRRDAPSGYTLSDEACDQASDHTRCGISLSEGRCLPGLEGGGRVSAPWSVAHPYCWCARSSPAAAACRLEWIDPVPCRRDGDCWIDFSSPTQRPIRRPRRLRGRRFRPCEDGEREPTCIDGFCGFDPARAYRC